MGGITNFQLLLVIVLAPEEMCWVNEWALDLDLNYYKINSSHLDLPPELTRAGEASVSAVSGRKECYPQKSGKY